MRALRTIFAVLIALLVVILPAAAGASGSMAEPTNIFLTDTSTMEDMDCCPEDSDPCEKAMDGCASMASCALKCFSFTGTSVPLVFRLTVRRNSISHLRGIFHPQSSSLPFRPPRV